MTAVSAMVIANNLYSCSRDWTQSTHSLLQSRSSDMRDSLLQALFRRPHDGNGTSLLCYTTKAKPSTIPSLLIRLPPSLCCPVLLLAPLHDDPEVASPLPTPVEDQLPSSHPMTTLLHKRRPASKTRTRLLR